MVGGGSYPVAYRATARGLRSGVNVTVLINPASGRGRAATLGGAVVEGLRRAGHDVAVRSTHLPSGEPGPTLHATEIGDALVVVGGDGTLHRALPAAAASGAGVYHVPAGTENLFARHFRMSAHPAAVVQALDRPPIRTDLGMCDGRLFALMASVGPDAGVIERLSRRRGGAISHWSYLRPVLAEFGHPRLARISLEVDGCRVLDNRRGLLVVANSPQYAARLDPGRGARTDDGRLDVVFFPCESGVDVVCWAARLWLCTDRPDGCLSWTARAASVFGREEATPLQLDGEPAGGLGTNDRPTKITILGGVLRVFG